MCDVLKLIPGFGTLDWFYFTRIGGRVRGDDRYI